MARTIDLEERKQFRVLLNPVRQDIIHLLRRAGRPMTANTVAEKMLLLPSAAQSHLNKLEELGVVELGVYTAPDGRQATYYRLADVEIRLCLGRKDGFQGEREALAAQLVDGTFRGVLHAASQCGEPEQQEDLQFLFGALHLKPEERAELLGLIDGYLRTHSVPEGGVEHWEKRAHGLPGGRGIKKEACGFTRRPCMFKSVAPFAVFDVELSLAQGDVQSGGPGGRGAGGPGGVPQQGVHTEYR